MPETPTPGGSADQEPEVIFSAGAEPAPGPPAGKRFPWRLAVALLAVAAVAAAVIYRVRATRPVELVRAVSPEVDFWMEFDAGAPGQEAKLKPLLDAAERAGLEQRFANLLEREASRSGFQVNWEKDLKPWVGSDFGFAVSGFFEAAMGGPRGFRAPSLLGVMEVRNPRKAEAFFNRLAEHLRTKERWNLTTQSQHGVGIHVCRPPGSFSEGEDLSYAVDGRALLVSNRASEVAGAIRRLRGDAESLAGADWYQKATAKAPAEAMGRGVFTTEHVSSFYQAMGQGLPEADRKQLEKMMEGVVTTGAVWCDISGQGIASGSFAFPSKGESQEARQALIAASRENVWKTGFTAAPKDSMATMGMLGVSDWYDMFAKQLQASPYSFLMPMLQAQSGLDMKEDVFGWMQGMSVTLISAGGGAGPVQVVGELRASSPEAARGKAEKLAASVCRLGQLTTRSATVGGTSATELLSAGRPVVCYGVAGSSVLIASDIGSLAAGVRAQREPKARMAAGDAWQKAAEAQGEPAWFAAFADTGQIARAVKAATPREEMRDGGEQAVGLLSSILWVAASGGASEEGYGSSFSAGIDYAGFCENLAGLLERAEKQLPENPRR